MPSASQPSAVVRDQIRSVLNTVWDPIGLEEPEGDEYDSYVGKLHGLLRDGEDDRKISDHLLKLETTSMGLSGSSEEHRARVVAALRSTSS